MFRLLRSLGIVAIAAGLARVAAPGSLVLAPWLPVGAVAVVGVAFGLERLGPARERAGRAPVGLLAGIAAVGIVLAVHGAPIRSVPMLLAGLVGAAGAVPLAGLVMEAFPGRGGRAHGVAGLIGLCALLPLGVYVLPGWAHPVTHWDPLFWLQHTFFRVHLTPAELAATGIRQPATFSWEYPVVALAEAAVFGWLLVRRIREQARLAPHRR